MPRRSTLAVTFNIHRGKFRKAKHPIVIRISINTTISSFYTRQYVSAEDWDVSGKRLASGHPDATSINEELDRLESLVFHHHKKIISRKGFVTADMVKKAILGEEEPATLLNVFRKHNEVYSKPAGVKFSPGTFRTYDGIYRSVEKFIRDYFQTDDIALRRLDIDFINNYEFYLRITKGNSQYTAWNYVMLLRKVVRTAIAKGLLSRDPFMGYTPERLKPNQDYLTEEEFHTIRGLDIQKPDICLARDMFVFSAFTGLSLCDIRSLKHTHISRSSDGGHWIFKQRDNTVMDSKIFLLDIPLRIIQKYNIRPNTDTIFDLPDRSTIGRHLKVISEMCGFYRNIIFRMARPCFAGLVTLKYGIPVETVSRMMGYSSAEAAAKFININKQKIADDIDALNEKMADLYKLPYSTSSTDKNHNSERKLPQKREF